MAPRKPALFLLEETDHTRITRVRLMLLTGHPDNYSPELIRRRRRLCPTPCISCGIQNLQIPYPSRLGMSIGPGLLTPSIQTTRGVSSPAVVVLSTPQISQLAVTFRDGLQKRRLQYVTATDLRNVKGADMRTRVVSIIVALAGLLSLATAQDHASSPFSLLLISEQATFVVGSPIMVELTTTNNSGKPLRLGKTNPGTEYQIEVHDEQGQPIAQTPLYKELQHPGYVLRSTSIVLKPHESSKETFDVARFFELNIPGQYSIQVQRPISRPLGTGVVKSNTVMVTVGPSIQ
jgi:hypothetical protein